MNLSFRPTNSYSYTWVTELYYECWVKNIISHTLCTAVHIYWSLNEWGTVQEGRWIEGMDCTRPCIPRLEQFFYKFVVLTTENALYAELRILSSNYSAYIYRTWPSTVTVLKKSLKYFLRNIWHSPTVRILAQSAGSCQQTEHGLQPFWVSPSVAYALLSQMFISYM
jgi:hypothetical protein